jgi:hypothetical protein
MRRRSSTRAPGAAPPVIDDHLTLVGVRPGRISVARRHSAGGCRAGLVGALPAAALVHGGAWPTGSLAAGGLGGAGGAGGETVGFFFV